MTRRPMSPFSSFMVPLTLAAIAGDVVILSDGHGIALEYPSPSCTTKKPLTAKLSAILPSAFRP